MNPASRVKGWRVALLYVVLPFVATVAVDRLTKIWALANPDVVQAGILELGLFKNFGFMLGGFSEASPFLTVLVPASLGGFLFYFFAVVQTYLPIKSRLFRVSLSVMFAGMLANIYERVQLGYVVDFMRLSVFGRSTGIFNVADALQWVGFGLFLAVFVRDRDIFYPPNERRGSRWVDPRFQLRYCLTLVLLGVALACVSGLISYAYLRVAITSVSAAQAPYVDELLAIFARIYALVSLTFFVSLFVVGMYLSHRIAGPIRKFGRFLDDAINGKVDASSPFRLRNADEFQELERLAERFQSFVSEDLGVSKLPLEAEAKAPDFTAKTFRDEEVSSLDLRGSKVWLIFYRYATCPLCAVHLAGIRDLIAEAKARGVRVLAVYQSNKDCFLKEDVGKTKELLESLEIPLIADPEKRLYSLFRTQKSVWATFLLSTGRVWLKARAQGYLQGTVDGDISQLPAHFFIDAKGKIVDAHYGQTATDHPSAERIRAFVAG